MTPQIKVERRPLLDKQLAKLEVAWEKWCKANPKVEVQPALVAQQAEQHESHEQAEQIEPQRVSSQHEVDPGLYVQENIAAARPAAIPSPAPKLVNPITLSNPPIQSPTPKPPSKLYSLEDREVLSKPTKQQQSSTLTTNSKKLAKNTWTVSQLDGHNSRVNSVCFFEKASKKYIATGSSDTTVRLWSLDSLTEIHSLGGHTESVTSVVMSSPSSLASASEDCSIRFWAVPGGSFEQSVYLYAPVSALVVHQDLLVSATTAGKIQLWRERRCVCSVQAFDEQIAALAVGPAGTLGAASRTGVVTVSPFLLMHAVFSHDHYLQSLYSHASGLTHRKINFLKFPRFGTFLAQN